MLTSFNVVSVTPTTKSETPGEIVKVQSKVTKSEVTPLGLKESTVQETYYMKVAKASVKPGQHVELDPDKYSIVLHPFTIPEGNENAGQVVQLKWLQL